MASFVSPGFTAEATVLALLNFLPFLFPDSFSTSFLTLPHLCKNQDAHGYEKEANLHILEFCMRKTLGGHSEIQQPLGGHSQGVHSIVTLVLEIHGCAKERMAFASWNLKSGGGGGGGQTLVNYRNKCDVAPVTRVTEEGTAVRLVVSSGSREGNQGRLPGGSAS